MLFTLTDFSLQIFYSERERLRDDPAGEILESGRKTVIKEFPYFRPDV